MRAVQKRESYVRGDTTPSCALACTVYLKKLSQRLGARSARVCVDLSHFTLLYFEGLIRVMRAEDLPFKLVRIVEEEVEAGEAGAQVVADPRVA